MPVNYLDHISANNYTIFKNLRTRKVSYVFTKSSEIKQNANPEREDIKHHSTGRVSNNKSVKKRNSDVKSVQKTNELKRKKTRSLSYLDDDDEIEVNFASPVKRVSENKSRISTSENVVTPKKLLSTSLVDGPKIDISVAIATPKRTYHKQNFELLKSGTKTRQKITNASFNDFSTIFRKLTRSDFEPIKKRRYNKKSRKSVDSKSKKQPIREVEDNSPLKVMTPKQTYSKRTKKNFELLKSGTKTRQKITNASFDDLSTIFRKLTRPDFEPIKKRQYTKKSLKSVDSKSKKQPIREVEDNSPLKVMTPKQTYSKRTKKTKPAIMKNEATSGIEGDFSSLSSFSQDSGFICRPVKRPRGRPKSTPDLTYVPFSDEDTTSTSSTQSSVSSSTFSTLSTSTGAKGGRRRTAPRPRPWWLDEEPAPDTLSEYELQRQRNIQQNLQMLRQIFSEKGLEEELNLNSSKDYKPRKTYSRHPLPPPRPKSERIEHSQPLDFSKMFKNDAYN